MRSFVAVKVAEPIRKRLLEVREQLRKADADVKWVEEATLHITLKFLGWVEDDAIATLKDLLAAEVPRWPVLRLEYSGVGTFPERGAPRVVWAGCGGDVAKLGDLAAAVERAAEQVGVPKEDRPFRPHLTIGRVKSPRNAKALQALIPVYRDTPFGSDTVTEVVLFESTLRPQGPIYTPRATFPLGATKQTL